MTKHEFGKRLRDARKKAGLTLDTVGRALGVTPQAVSQWERGINAPSQIDVTRLARIVRTDPIYLLAARSDVPHHSPGVGEGRAVPLYSLRDMLFPPKDIAELPTIPVRYPAGPQAFATTVWDRSNEPGFKIGDEIVLDPDITPVPDDMVAVVVETPEPRVFFGRWVETMADGVEAIELHFANPSWRPRTLLPTQPYRVLGVLVEHTWRRRQT